MRSSPCLAIALLPNKILDSMMMEGVLSCLVYSQEAIAPNASTTISLTKIDA